MRFGIADKAIQSMLDIFSRHPAVRRVDLFGSRARGDHRPNSDIDLVVWGELDRREMNALAAELEELPIPWNVDIERFEDIAHAPLREEIERTGKTLFLAKEGQGIETEGAP